MRLLLVILVSVVAGFLFVGILQLTNLLPVNASANSALLLTIIALTTIIMLSPFKKLFKQ